jgi:hypothetical protein
MLRTRNQLDEFIPNPERRREQTPGGEAGREHMDFSFSLSPGDSTPVAPVVSSRHGQDGRDTWNNDIGSGISRLLWYQAQPDCEKAVRRTSRSLFMAPRTCARGSVILSAALFAPPLGYSA